MNAHFSSFTPEAMRALGQDLADGFQRRTEFLNNTRNHTCVMLAGFQKKRQESASREADARRLFMSELKSGVHSLMGRFELSRKEMAGDLQEMARECHAASDVFRNRPGHQGGSSRRDHTGQAPKQTPKQTPSSTSAQPFRPAAESQSASAQPFRPAAESQSASAQPFRPAAESQDSPKVRSGVDEKPGDTKKHHG